MSVWLPGVNGTTMRTVWLGKACAAAGDEPPTARPIETASDVTASLANRHRREAIMSLQVEIPDGTLHLKPDQLLIGLQIGDEVVGIGRARDAAKRHAV